MWEKLSTVEKFFSIIVVMGSIVDVFQFSWIIKRTFRRVRNSIYAKAKRDLILEAQLQKKDDK